MSALEARLEAYRAAHASKDLGGFRYTAAGPAGAPALLLLHGGGSIAEAAHPYALALEDAFRVVNVDWPADARTVAEVTAGLRAILDAEGVDRASVLGFSMGGMLAQALLRESPDRVDRLVLFVSMGPSQRFAKRFRRYRTMLGLMPAGLLSRMSRRAAAKWAAAGEASDAEARTFVAAQRASMFDRGLVSKASLLSDADILVDFFSSPLPAPVTSPPVLIVEGEHDRMVDADERAALRAAFPAAQVITLPGTDHFAAQLAPPELVAQIRSFLLGPA